MPVPRKKRRKMKFAFKDGARFSKPLLNKAQQVGEELARLENGSGGLTAARVIAAARKLASPLHPFFEWDNTKAAAEYRLEQARYVIRYVIIEDAPGHDAPVKSYYCVPKDETDDIDGREIYRPTMLLLESPKHRKQLCKQAKSELKQWRLRWAILSDDLGTLFRAIDRHVG